MLRSLQCFFLLAVFTAPGLAQTPTATPPATSTPIPSAPAVDARSYIVIDYRTDKILAAKDAVARMEPASLTKLMTAYIVFQELAAGKLKLDEPDGGNLCAIDEHQCEAPRHGGHEFRE
jgi:D-alanyl-D-alanine carboxypeptidase (penicillin-binding protein 5/6)